ncbi:family 20 glycosylhydrolase [Pseudoalteromonas sp. Of11M-6]|uniref:family 20 glycosylhydrolase n=1 Tax=Pseudoalteromonas sp. Of11M-6 TaxID=2917754 RepID=UPI001EF48D14|nr:family 20 glycosylhydrolase [Pseudoalteromonas sp. Of11M-6]MCG7554284.1 carbohydate-binding domain-containing protein [Pseudoalteromonas sp. Of11M-6]
MKFNRLMALLFGVSSPLYALDQTAVNWLGQNLDVKYTLLDSKPSTCPKAQQKCYYSELSFSVATENTKANNDFAIFFSQLMPIYHVEGDNFAITHINGDIHKITPAAGFSGFSSTPTTVRFYTKDSQVTRSEFMPNYVVTDAQLKLTPQVIKSTQTQRDNDTGLELQPYLTPFDTLNQLQTSSKDDTPWMGSEYLYQHQVKPTLDVAIGLIPKPKQLTVLSDKRLNLAAGINLQLSGISADAIAMAQQRLNTLGVKSTKDGLVVNVAVKPNKQSSPHYQLTVAENYISIQANNSAAAFYALQSLAGLLDINDLSIPIVGINDTPRYDFRGLHVDVARNFRSKAFILQTIEQMAAYKLNKLHLHLADDEGWRLAIDGLDELTSVGAYRCFDLTETRCLLPQLGAGNDKNAQVNGFYSAEDYIEILRYAKAHHIEVLPSLDMPGHSRAAIIAMEARYKKLMAQGKPEDAQQYRLVEAADKTRYSSIQHYNDNTLNVCIANTYTFIDKVLSEVKVLHDRAGVPLNTYHIGADETAGAWLESPACEKLQASVKDFTNFNGYFIERIAKLLDKKGIQVAGWSDGLGDVRAANMPANVQSNAWATLSENGHAVAHRFANQGWQVVLSSPDVTYFDFPYQSHPEERGNHWASRAIESKKMFEFMPDNLPAHAEIWKNTNNHAYIANDSDSSLNKGVKFAGLQGHLWSEMLRSDAQAEYMLYPRLLALAERAWHHAEWELPYQAGRIYSQSSGYFTAKLQAQREADWQRFVAILGHQELPKLAQAGIEFRIPVVAAKQLSGAKLDAFTAIPGFVIEAQLENGNWVPFNTSLSNVLALRAARLGSERKGRSLSLDKK